MKFINPGSLSETLDAVNEALFFGRNISTEQKTDIAGWIVSRQGLPGSYWRMFAPTKKDFETGIKVFTGEPMNSSAGISHILGEEASSILLKLGIKNITVATALERSKKGFEAAMKRSLKAASNNEGKYCCGICSVAYWRNLASGGLSKQRKRLALGMKYLNSRRDGKSATGGRWRSMPYYYTLLALSEIDLPSAKKEIEYAAPGLEKLLKRIKGNDKYGKRRRALVERVLGMV
jgi:hypothetical protein